MGIINREVFRQNRRINFEVVTGAIATGVTTIVGLLPLNSLITGVYATAFGLSNTPTTSFSLYRFIAGTGFTVIPLGTTLTVPAYGTSGFAYYGATVNGNTTANVIGITSLQGDLLVALSGTANSSVINNAILGGVIEPTDDILRWPGL